MCGPLTYALPFAPALWLALPEHATAIPIDAKRLVEAITVQTRVRIDRNAMNAASRGRAGGLMAIGAAATSLREGKVGAALVCGADTFIDAFVLGTMDLEQRVKSNANLDGFVPGEGAGVVLLLTRAVAAQLGIAPVATIAAAGNGAEKGHLYSTEPYRGEGLATTLQMLFASAGTLPPITSVFSSMNGESHWGQEWGVSVVRNSAAIDPNVLMHHPADCYGDVGAAAGPLLTTLASLALRGGRSASPTLVYASSDYGDRSALILVGN
jgi:3-oxoacyl-[acyl-carrier-protein] synthase-1